MSEQRDPRQRSATDSSSAAALLYGAELVAAVATVVGLLADHPAIAVPVAVAGYLAAVVALAVLLRRRGTAPGLVAGSGVLLVLGLLVGGAGGYQLGRSGSDTGARTPGTSSGQTPQLVPRSTPSPVPSPGASSSAPQVTETLPSGGSWQGTKLLIQFPGGADLDVGPPGWGVTTTRDGQTDIAMGNGGLSAVVVPGQFVLTQGQPDRAKCSDPTRSRGTSIPVADLKVAQALCLTTSGGQLAWITVRNYSAPEPGNLGSLVFDVLLWRNG